MNVYITKVNGLSLENSLQYKQWMIARIAHGLGFREMGIFCYNGDAESDENLRCRLDGIVAGLSWGEDVVVCQFPTGNGLRFESGLINRLKVYQVKIIIFIYDVENLVCESNQAELAGRIGLYNQAEVLIIPSLLMQQFLLDNGIRNDMKFIIQEMWDYKLDMNYVHFPQFCREIHYTGYEFAGMADWHLTVPLKVYASSAEQRKNVNYVGQLSTGELVSALSKGGFGLVWYQNKNSQRGLEYGNSLELSRYLATGIPVIVPAGISNQTLIEKNHLGIVVDSIEEAVTAVTEVTEGEYHGYIRGIRRFAPALRGEYYTKKCLVDAIHAICTKDAGKINTPVNVYDSGEHEFTYTVLKESYGGKLAFSWSYRGEADGFLIYDTFGKLIHETRNIYQHYFQIRGYGKESGFIVKAYIDTMKGKMSIGESKPTYLYTGKYEQPEVSLVIPVYNAEDYIARSIDTALAQSFFNLEIIIVNDGSTDHTSDMIEWYAEKFPNVKVIHQENSGVAAARNMGIKYAGGEYIGFMDNDDMIRPEMISSLYDMASMKDCDVVVSSVYQINDSGYNIFIRHYMPENTGILTAEDFFKMHFIHGKKLVPAIWNKLYRSLLVKEHPLPIILGDDGAWTPYILSYADKICCSSECYYEWDRTIRKNTLISDWMGKSRNELLELYKNIVTFYLENGNPKKMELLKEQARRELLDLRQMYADDRYEELWHEIEASF